MVLNLGWWLCLKQNYLLDQNYFFLAHTQTCGPDGKNVSTRGVFFVVFMISCLWYTNFQIHVMWSGWIQSIITLWLILPHASHKPQGYVSQNKKKLMAHRRWLLLVTPSPTDSPLFRPPLSEHSNNRTTWLSAGYVFLDRNALSEGLRTVTQEKSCAKKIVEHTGATFTWASSKFT